MRDVPHIMATRAPDDLKAVFNALRKLVRAVRLSSHEVKTALGISGSQLFVLQQLIDHPNASLRDLSKLTHTDHSSVSVVAARLVSRKLVVRKTSAIDARRVELSLTAKGRALLKKPPEVVQQRLVRALEALKAKELAQLRTLLERVVRDAGFEGEPAEMFLESIR